MPPISPLAPMAPPKGERPVTLEGVASFRVHTAALARPVAPQADEVVLVTDEEGRVLVYPAGGKLAILSAERAKRLPKT